MAAERPGGVGDGGVDAAGGGGGGGLGRGDDLAADISA